MRLQRRNVVTVLCGTGKIASLGGKTRNLVPKDFKYSKSFNDFQKIFEKGLKISFLAVYANCVCKAQGLYKG